MEKVVLFWFRRDLRIEDNVGLHFALSSGFRVIPLFIFDTDILQKLDNKCDRRVDYIHQAISSINEQIGEYQSSILVYTGKPLDVFQKLTETYSVESVYCNHDYEPEAIRRNREIEIFLVNKNISFKGFKDQVIFETTDILKNDGKPYTVYTPYSKRWRSALTPSDYRSYNSDYSNFFPLQLLPIPSLDTIGFEKTDLEFHTPTLKESVINDYEKHRDFPALDRTSHLGIALRFGTISIRKCVAFALEHNDTWLSELIWREFFMQILFHFPHVQTKCFRLEYENIEWLNNERDFACWCSGETGYPIVDAGMRQLNQTGFMHNRVRMIVASFLTKHLLIDWRWGEAYFAEKLLDYDLAANNGNWQWAAGCGCDAAPYFRIFNPTSQTEKFDKELSYIRQWNPDFEKQGITQIVKHEEARERVLKAYKKALSR